MDVTKIIFVTSNLTCTGGLQSVTVALANAFSKKKEYMVCIVNLGEKQGEEKYVIESNINIYYLGINSINVSSKIDRIKNLVNSYKQLSKYLKKIDMKDTIIIAMGTASSYVLPYIKSCKKAICIGTQHNPVRHSILGDLFRKYTIKKLDRYIMLDKDTFEEMSNILKVDNLGVISNPMTIKIQGVSKRINKEVLAVGRLTYQKGFDLLIESWVQIAEKYPDWKLKIIGEGEEGPKLKKMIEDKKLEQFIQLMPFTMNIQQHYVEASIFVLSSRYEGFGLVIIEAQAHGLPVVSFDCPTGPRNIISNNKDGFLVPVEDIKVLSNKIAELIEDQNLRNKMGIWAQENSQKYQIEAILNQWISEINKIKEVRI